MRPNLSPFLQGIIERNRPHLNDALITRWQNAMTHTPTGIHEAHRTMFYTNRAIRRGVPRRNPVLQYWAAKWGLLEAQLEACKDIDIAFITLATDEPRTQEVLDLLPERFELMLKALEMLVNLGREVFTNKKLRRFVRREEERMVAPS